MHNTMIKIVVGNESLTKPYRNTTESLHEIKVTETTASQDLLGALKRY